MSRPLSRSFTVLGHRIPFVIGILAGLTVFASAFGALFSRNGVPFFDAAVLAPAGVWAGQLWRLVTWVFVEPQGLSLIFGCVALVMWFGPDLVAAWGPGRFLATYLGISAAAGGLTCLIARFWPGLMGAVSFGVWGVIDPLIIAWAVIFPYRDIALFFVLPVRGRNLIYATVGLTVVFALLYGIEFFVPHFLAEGLMLAYLRWSPRDLWLRLRYRLLTRKLWSPPPHLRPVQKNRRDDEPPRWLH